MGLPKLETCCFFFDLKTGNTIMGCLNAVLSFTMMVVMIVFAATLGTVEEELPSVPEDVLPSVSEENNIELKAAVTGLYAMCIILVLMFLAKFIFDIVFVYGVVTERAAIIKSYMIMWIVFFLLSMYIFFLNSPNFSVGTICTEVFYIGLNIYVILLSHSYYKQLNNREDV